MISWIKNWFTKKDNPFVVIESDWNNNHSSYQYLRNKVLAERHALWMYLTTESPIKDELRDLVSLESIGMPVSILRDQMGIQINKATFQPFYTIFHHEIPLEDHKYHNIIVTLKHRISHHLCEIEKLEASMLTGVVGGYRVN